ncbi:MAG: zinc-dependent alcohol dehydrogenase [Anaerolineae bacterium]
MRAAIVQQAGVLSLCDVPMPEMGTYQALVRIEACSLCNSTDVKLIDRHFCSHIPVPFVLGHESVGTVIEVGEHVRAYRPGQRVLRPGAEYDMASVGIASAWGGFAEYGLATDLAAWQANHPNQRPGGMWAKQQVVPASIDVGDATAIITLKEVLSAARAAGIGPTTRTAIIGTGPVARAFTFWARWLGAPDLVVFGRRDRWQWDLLRLGADAYVIGGADAYLAEAAARSDRTFDRVIEAVGSSAAMRDALALLGPEGVVGNYGVPSEGDPADAQTLAARASGRIVDLAVREEDVHQEVLELVARGDIVLGDWTSHRLPLEGILHGVELLRSKEATKVVIEI